MDSLVDLKNKIDEFVTERKEIGINSINQVT